MSRFALEASFRATTYRIDADGLRFDLRIDQENPLFCEFLRSHAVEHWALITAYNPGALYCDAENARFHSVFLARLSDIGCTFFRLRMLQMGACGLQNPGFFYCMLMSLKPAHWLSNFPNKPLSTVKRMVSHV